MAKIGKDVAEEQLKKICASRRIAYDLSEFTKGEQAVFDSRKAPLLRMMMVGTLVLNQEGNPVYTPPVEKAAGITFYHATGATLMAGDSSGGPAERLIMMATELTKSEPGALSKLALPDFRAVDDITTFLIGR